MARIDFHGRLVDEPEVRIGVIGCGSHAFRNIFPTFQFAPIRLVATCDLDEDRAAAFASKFGAQASYGDHRRMLERDDLDAVVIVVGYDDRGRPRYPALAAECLEAGCHVWIEKPPAASCAEIDGLQQVATRSGRTVMVGFKKMFAPANEHAKRLAQRDDFGDVALARLEYPQYVPKPEAFARYAGGEAVSSVVSFLDHLCHPASLLVYLLGVPSFLTYERAHSGAAVATFSYEDGSLASLTLTHGGAFAAGGERTVLLGDRGRHIEVENNLRVSYHRTPITGYGDVVDAYATDVDQTTTVWQPEFSLGQLYNKGLFILGYYNELAEFARAIIEGRAVVKAGLDDAWAVTRLFEAFSEGPGHRVALGKEAGDGS